MSRTGILAAPRTERAARGGLITRLAQRTVLRHLAAIREGQLNFHAGDETFRFGHAGGRPSLRATVSIHDPAFFRRVASGGTLGAADAFAEGLWTCDDLTALIRIMVRNERHLGKLDSGLARLRAPFHRLAHLLRRNTVRGSRRNIHAHYDLGNGFYRLWLDETLSYSCALFERETMTLAEASTAKIDRLCDLLALSAQDHLLEIGTGWGGFALRAAQRTGCRVTTTTISAEQHRLASERVREAGLEDRVTVLQRDYRELAGQFDKAVSVEMIEAVGHRHLDGYVSTLSALLHPGGRVALQAILMNDQEHPRYLRSADFIQRRIFPGSCLPSITSIMRSIARASDLRLTHFDDLTPHYVTTLQAWRERLMARAGQVRELGFPESFLRLWDYYLCYCAGGFAERKIGVAHLLFEKRGCA